MSVLLTGLLGKIWPYLAGLAGVAVVGFGIYHLGETHVQAEWDAAKKAEAAQVAQIGTQQQAVTTKTVIQYVDKVQIVHDKAKAIVKQVPVYITKHDDANCAINGGFVSVWNAANSGVQLPNTPSGAYEAPSGITLSRLAIEHSTDAEYTHQVETQLTGLQDWITAEQAASQPQK